MGILRSATIEHPEQSYNVTLKNNIILPGGGSDTPFMMGLGSITSNVTDPASGYGTCTTTIEHNTIYVGSGMGVSFGEVVGSVAGTVASFRSNALWRTGTALAGTYACRSRFPDGKQSGYPRVAEMF